MGNKLSIDKNVSELEDILSMSPSYFKKIRFENKSPLAIAHHLKVKTASIGLAILSTVELAWISSQ